MSLPTVVAVHYTSRRSTWLPKHARVLFFTHRRNVSCSLMHSLIHFHLLTERTLLVGSTDFLVSCLCSSLLRHSVLDCPVLAAASMLMSCYGIAQTVLHRYVRSHYHCSPADCACGHAEDEHRGRTERDDQLARLESEADSHSCLWEHCNCHAYERDKTITSKFGKLDQPKCGELRRCYNAVCCRPGWLAAREREKHAHCKLESDQKAARKKLILATRMHASAAAAHRSHTAPPTPPHPPCIAMVRARQSIV
jgi:hypothetical protein